MRLLLDSVVKRLLGHGGDPVIQLQTAFGGGKTHTLLAVYHLAKGIGRFARVGQYASYCRCVDSHKISNGKRKGSGNTKNGNKYLAWACVEAANSPSVKA
jgi:Predicted ATPase (AAA+ superfamily)